MKSEVEVDETQGKASSSYSTSTTSGVEKKREVRCGCIFRR